MHWKWAIVVGGGRGENPRGKKKVMKVGDENFSHKLLLNPDS